MEGPVTKGYQVRLPTKIVYGLGSVSDGVKNTTFNVFLLFFYTQVAGLSGSLAGAAILIALGGVRSEHLAPVMKSLEESRLAVTIERVPYEFVRGANQMMRVRNSAQRRT